MFWDFISLHPETTHQVSFQWQRHPWWPPPHERLRFPHLQDGQCSRRPCLLQVPLQGECSLPEGWKLVKVHMQSVEWYSLPVSVINFCSLLLCFSFSVYLLLPYCFLLLHALTSSFYPSPLPPSSSITSSFSPSPFFWSSSMSSFLLPPNSIPSFLSFFPSLLSHRLTKVSKIWVWIMLLFSQEWTQTTVWRTSLKPLPRKTLWVFHDSFS